MIKLPAFCISIIIVGVVCFVLGGVFHHETTSNDSSLPDSYAEIYEILSGEWLDYEGNITDLDETLLKGLVDALGDPYTEYLTVEESTSYTSSLQSDYVGIGVTITTYDNTYIISKVHFGSPAKEAGLENGDEIISVDGTDASTLTKDELVSLIQGEENTEVTLGILRYGTTMSFTMTRAQLDSSAIYEIVDNGDNLYGYLLLSSFSSTTASAVEDALSYFKEQGINDLVIDLRGNPGGYVDSVIDTLDLFFDSGELVCILEENDGTQTNYYTSSDTKYQFVNAYILVDGDTASAAEILAGTLQEKLDYQLVGTQTYGKGVAQITHTLSDMTTLKYTFAKWLLPSGDNIQGEGLTPDIEVENIDTEFYYSFNLDGETLQIDTVDDRTSVLQQMLVILGYEVDRTDGYYSESTRQQVMQFESDYGLSVDGIINEDDRSAIFSQFLQYINSDENDYQLLKVKELLQ